MTKLQLLLAVDSARRALRCAPPGQVTRYRKAHQRAVTALLQWEVDQCAS